MRSLLASLTLALLLPSFAAAASAPKVATEASAFRNEVFANLDDVERKIVSLAEATPESKFTWRPGKGVRSISEVYMHIAGSNYVLASFLGVQAPRTNGDAETRVTKKGEVLAELRRSFEHLHEAISTTNDLDRPVKLFGSQTTRRGVVLTIVSHLHEHLGQSIAYARMNNVVPPWSH